MRLFILSFTILVIVSLAACNTQPAPPPPPTATSVSFLTQPTPASQAIIAPASPSATLPASAPSPTPLPLPSPLSTPLPQPTATNTSVSTPTPLPSPTATPAPLVLVPADSTNSINVRSGPGTDYPILGRFEPGQTAPVTGRNDDGSWWQVSLDQGSLGWIFGELVTVTGQAQAIPVTQAPPPPPTATPAPQTQTEAAPPAEASGNSSQASIGSQSPAAQNLRQQLTCTQDFCVTYQAMLPIWENGGCIGNHSIYITVLEGPPPGRPVDGIVVGDTFNNVEVASGAKGPGQAEITLWMNSMSVKVKRHIDGTPYTSQESFSFTSHDELIPAEVLAANGYCDGSVEKCRVAQNQNQVCRGHYSYRVTFHKLD